MCPAGHGEHLPDTQYLMMFEPSGVQRCPHAPQFDGSVWRLVQAAPHVVREQTQCAEASQSPTLHALPQQRWPSAPQATQLPPSQAPELQAPEQQGWPTAPHATHVPPAQVAPGLQEEEGQQGCPAAPQGP